MKDILVSLALLLWEVLVFVVFIVWEIVCFLGRFILVLAVVPIWVVLYSLAWGLFWFFDSSVPPLRYMLRHCSIFETRPAQLWEYIMYG